MAFGGGHSRADFMGHGGMCHAFANGWCTEGTVSRKKTANKKLANL